MPLSLRHLLPLLAAFLVLPASAAGLPAEVEQALTAARIPVDAVTVLAQPVDGSPPAVAVNASQAMNPASVMKLVTTYGALELLGPAHTWKTVVWTDAPVRDGRIGKLYLQGSGDPKFALEHLWALLRQLRARGITEITGDLVLDHSAFSLPPHDPGIFDGRPTRPYNVGSDALLFNFQSYSLLLQPQGERIAVLPLTPAEGLVIDNSLQASRQTCGSDWKDALTVHFTGDGEHLRLQLAGRYATACGEKILNVAPADDDAYFASVFRALWRELGGSFGGRVRSGPRPANALALAGNESPPLLDIVRDINKYSNNVMASELLLSLADSAPATLPAARARLTLWLAGKGVAAGEVEVDNGSGLSRNARISGGALNRLLQAAWRSPVMPELISSLPIAGQDGTMKKRLQDSPALGRAHIKSGTLDGVKSAAGYVLDARGCMWTLVFIINHPRASAGGPAIDAMLDWLVEPTTP
jgi:serine-type D-Ala-D-Ala carboxypeptidase/endopeptidase (penicillin-binding protein 4)